MSVPTPGTSMAGLDIGESGAAPLAALRQDGVQPGSAATVLLVATEGPTGGPLPG